MTLECVRFGARLPAIGIGCCAIDLIQGFSCDPDGPVERKMVHGDAGTALTLNGKQAFAGPTNRALFNIYLKTGTFDTQDSPDRAFFCALSDYQLKTDYGKKWLEIIKDAGFEFLRTINNTVYNQGRGTTPHMVHIFALFRNISSARVRDPLTPPQQWLDTPEGRGAEKWYKETKTEIMLKDLPAKAVAPAAVGAAKAA